MLLVYEATGAVDIVGMVNHYAISAKTRDAGLSAHTVFVKDLEILRKVPKGSTVVIELVLKDAPSGWVEVVPGLSIMWRAPLIASVIITKPDAKYVVATTSPDVTVKPITKLSIAEIHCSPDFHFVRLLFSWLPVSEAYLNTLSNEIANRERLLKALKH
jgi:hypothetical protein